MTVTETPPAAGMSADARPADADFRDEGIVTEFWPAAEESNFLYAIANAIPLRLGFPLFFGAFLLKVAMPWRVVRFTLTTRRLRKDRGMARRTESYVVLEDIDQIKLENEMTSLRTGDVVILANGEERLRMVGVQDPKPAMLSIEKAVRARSMTAAVLRQQASVN